MKKNLIKSKSRNIQQKHIRRYPSGKITLINKNKNKIKIRTTPKNTPRIRQKPRPQQPPKTENTPRYEKPRLEPKTREHKPLKKEDLTILLSPMTLKIITANGGSNWGDELKKKNKKLLETIKQKRFIQLMRDEQDYKTNALDEEAMIYISTLTMLGPIRPELTEIYLYLFNKWKPNHNDPALKFNKELTNYQKSMLTRLKQNIRRTQLQEFKKQNKGEMIKW